MDSLEILFPFVIFFAALLGVIIFWGLPVFFGIQQFKKKGYSPLWMLFGLHPMGAWIAFIVSICISERPQCQNCGGFMLSNFKICPYCGSRNPHEFAQRI